MSEPQIYPTILEAAGIIDEIKGESVTTIRSQRIPTTKISGPYAEWAESPRLSTRINQDSLPTLMSRLGVSEMIAKEIIAFRDKKPIEHPEDLLAIRGVGKNVLRKWGYLVATANNGHPHITNLHFANEHLYSNQPYQLIIEFVPAAQNRVTLLETTIFWLGNPYSIQRLITPEESAKGTVVIAFGEEDYLPVGPVRFQVRLFDAGAGTTEVGIGTYVLPSNPLQVRLTPGRGHFLSWIVRTQLNIADRSFTTVVDWTVSNSTGTTRRFNEFDWIATDGGRHIETIHDRFSFSVANNAAVSFRTTFTSPANSPIGSLFNNGWDITLKIQLKDDRGSIIESSIVVQPWLGYNLNIIRVGPFQSGDRAGLLQAANHASSIYQQINLTGNRVENNWLLTGDTTEWETIDDDEVDDLFQHASVTNDGLDLFIVRDFTGGTGVSPRPGDCSKGGSHDGVILDRRYDAAGNLYWRGMGQTMAHEFGHYFGLHHTPEDSASDFRVMHPVFREDRTVFEWSEYYEAVNHCFILLIF